MLPLAKQVPPYSCRLGRTRYLPMKCSKYISVTSFAVLNQHSLGTAFSWKFLQNIIHWRGYFHKGWFSKWSKRGSERFIGSFQCWTLLTEKRMIMQVSRCGLNFQRMNLSLFISFEINALCSLVYTLLLIAQALYHTCIWMTLFTFQDVFSFAISFVLLHTTVRYASHVRLAKFER